MPLYDVNGNVVQRLSPSGPRLVGPNQFERNLNWYTQGAISVTGAPGTLVELLDLGLLDLALFPDTALPPAVPDPPVFLDYLMTAQVTENTGNGATTGTLELHADVDGADQIRGGVNNTIEANGTVSMCWSRYGFSTSDAAAWFQGSRIVLYARAGATAQTLYSEIGVSLRMHFGT